MEVDKETGGDEQIKLDSNSRQNGNNSSNLSRYPLRLRNPDLYNCHVCGSQINTKRGKDKIRTLDSQWRIVIICNACFKNVQSAKNCSYCFLDLDEVGICCVVCSRRVHRECKSMYGRLNSWGDSGLGMGGGEGSFTCIDCWVPKSVNKVGCGGKSKRKSNGKNSGKVDGGSSIASNSSSLVMPRVSADDRGCSLEAAAKNANMTAEMKVADAAKARGKALEKAVVAKRAAEMAASALDLAVVAGTEESHVNGGCALPVVDDKELALRLHRAMNSSSRILRNMQSMKLDDLASPEKMRCDGDSLSMQSGQGNQVSYNVEVGTNDLISENPDDAGSEPSVQIGTVDRGSPNDMGISEPGAKMKSKENCGLKVFKRRSNAIKTKLPDYDYSAADHSMKEDHTSCSSKETISIGYCNSTESGSQCCQSQEGLKHSVALHNKSSLHQSVYENDSSLLENESSRGVNMFLRKYSRRGRSQNMSIKTYSRRRQIQNMYVRKYSRRTKSQLVLDQNTNIHSESFHLETQASGTAIPLMKMNNAEVLVTAGSYIRSPLPLQDSTSTSNPSWHCSQDNRRFV